MPLESNRLTPWATPAAVLCGALLLAAVVRAGFADLARVVAGSSGSCHGAPSVVEGDASELRRGTAAAPSAVASPTPDPLEARRLDQDRAAKLRDDVNNAFAEQRDAYKKACAPPPGPPGPNYPPSVEAELTFTAEGLERARELRVPAGPRGADPKTLACLRAMKTTPLRIPAPGQERTLAVPLLLF